MNNVTGSKDHLEAHYENAIELVSQVSNIPNEKFELILHTLKGNLEGANKILENRFFSLRDVKEVRVINKNDSEAYIPFAYAALALCPSVELITRLFTSIYSSRGIDSTRLCYENVEKFRTSIYYNTIGNTRDIFSADYEPLIKRTNYFERNLDVVHDIICPERRDRLTEALRRFLVNDVASLVLDYFGNGYNFDGELKIFRTPICCVQ